MATSAEEQRKLVQRAQESVKPVNVEIRGQHVLINKNIYTDYGTASKSRHW